MKLVSMISVGGESVIIAEVVGGEAVSPGALIEGGTGRVVLVGDLPPQLAALAAPHIIPLGGRSLVQPVEVFMTEQFTVRPADLPEDQPFVPVSLGPPESIGFVLARRVRDGLKTLTIDGGN